MTGREAPSDTELLQAIERRMADLSARDLTPPENATYTGSTGLYIEQVSYNIMFVRLYSPL
jgi:hypothetical protein